MINEVFKAVPNYPLYQVSNFGNVRRARTRGGYTTLKPFISGMHYNVSFYKDGLRKDIRVHRLVLQLFVGPAPVGAPLGLHRDDDPANNHVDNLMWGDKRLNARQAVANGRLRSGKERTYLHPIAARDIKTIFDHGHISMTQLGHAYNVSRWTVSNIVHDRVQRFL